MIICKCGEDMKLVGIYGDGITEPMERAHECLSCGLGFVDGETFGQWFDKDGREIKGE